MRILERGHEGVRSFGRNELVDGAVAVRRDRLRDAREPLNDVDQVGALVGHVAARKVPEVAPVAEAHGIEGLFPAGPTKRSQSSRSRNTGRVRSSMFQYHSARTKSIWPSVPWSMTPFASITGGELRRCMPIWTLRRVLRTSFTMSTPSSIERDIGLSQYAVF